MKKKILLVGWDAADWEIIRPLLDSGAMPNLQRLIEGGTMGNLNTLRPVLSPILWNSISTGKRADQHGILGFVQVDPASGKVRPSGTMNRQVKAVWNILSQEGWRCHVVNWLASHPAEKINGVSVSETFIRQLHRNPRDASPPVGSVHPVPYARTLADFVVRPEEIDASTIGLFVPRFGEIDQAQDHTLESLANILAECLTIHSSATYLMEAEPWDFMAVYYPTLDHFSHEFMKYRAPKLDHISQAEFEFYRDVLDGGYRMHDLLLGRLLSLAGEDATIMLCSDHGFLAGEARRPMTASVPNSPVLEHRSHGVFVVKGPGIKADGLVHGAGLLDIAPTVMAVAGIPLARDLDGRPLLEIFENPPPPSLIDSWETVAGPDWKPDTTPDETADAALLNQFVALGYVLPQTGSDESYARIIQAETDWSLACVHLHAGRFRPAVPLLERIYEEFPLRFDFGLLLGECYLWMGLIDEGREVIGQIAAALPSTGQAFLLQGLLENAAGNMKEGLTLLQKARRSGLQSSPDLLYRLGSAHFRFNQLNEARDCFDTVLKADPDHASAHLGVARCLLRQHQFQAAAEAALEATGREFSLAEAHLVLGIALQQLGDIAGATRAFETALRFNPHRLVILRFLLSSYRHQPGREADIRRVQLMVKEHLHASAQRAQNVLKTRAEVKARRAALQAASDVFLAGVPAPAPPVVVARPEFVIVSGLPRSGTSVMMQMLDRGGFPVMTDRVRTPDTDNPEGYYEWEPIKRLPQNCYLILQCAGHAVKIISMLLVHLPREFNYKVIFMDRPVNEIAVSQQKMRQRLNPSALLEKSVEEMTALLEQHRSQVLAGLKEAREATLLVVDYPTLINRPEETARTVADFLGRERLPRWQQMHEAVRRDLYRNRKPALSSNA